MGEAVDSPTPAEAHQPVKCRNVCVGSANAVRNLLLQPSACCLLPPSASLGSCWNVNINHVEPASEPASDLSSLRGALLF